MKPRALNSRRKLHTTVYAKAVDLVEWLSYGLLINNEGLF